MSASCGAWLRRAPLRLAPALLVACSAAPPVASSSGAAVDAAAAAAPSPRPRPASPEVGPLVRVPLPPGERRSLSVDLHVARASSFAVAVADLRGPERAEPRCPVTTPGCSLLAVARYDAPRSHLERLGAVPLAGLGAFSAPSPGSATWVAVSSGERVVYALRDADHLVLDAIDETGAATLLVSDDRPARWISARVLETANGLVVVGAVLDSVVATLRVARIEGRGAGARLAGEVALRIGVIPHSMHLPSTLAMFAPLRLDPVRADWGASPVLDATGSPGETWALAFLQIDRAGRGRRRRGEPRAHRAPGPPDEPVLEKQIRILRFKGTKLVSDHAVQGGDSMATFPFRVGAGPAGTVDVQGVLYGPDGKAVGPSTVQPAADAVGLASMTIAGMTELTMAPPPRIRSLAFDRASGEGVVLFATDAGPRGQRFDADGAPRGEAFPIADAEGTAVRVGDTWLSWSRLRRDVFLLTGPHAGQRVAWEAPLHLPTLARADGDHLELLFRGADGGGRCASLSIDVRTLEQRVLPGPSCAHSARAAAWVTTPDGKTALLGFDRDSFLTPETANGEETSELVTPAVPGQPLWSERPRVARVWGDHVVVERGTAGFVATWVAHGRSVRVPDPDATPDEDPGAAERRIGADRGARLQGAPLLARHLLLPDAPGTPVDARVLATFEDRCPWYVPTGPGQAVLACVEPDDPVKPGLTLGLRSFRH